MRLLTERKSASALRYSSPSRCQAIEHRIINDRARRGDRVGERRMHTVQCSLYRHVESIPHECHGREFGKPAKPAQPSKEPNRCPETELRLVMSGKWVTVRCTGKKNLPHECRYGSRYFGQELAHATKKRHGRAA